MCMAGSVISSSHCWGCHSPGTTVCVTDQSWAEKGTPETQDGREMWRVWRQGGWRGGCCGVQPRVPWGGELQLLSEWREQSLWENWDTPCSKIPTPELRVRDWLVCLWGGLETDPSYKGLDFHHAGFRDGVWDLAGTVNAHPHIILRCAGGHSAPVCLRNKADPSWDPRPCVCQLSDRIQREFTGSKEVATGLRAVVVSHSPAGCCHRLHGQC